MNDRNIKYLNLLTKIAKDTIPVSNARLCACLVYKNEILSIGVNSFKSHPFQYRFRKHERAIYIHAETDAIKNCIKRFGHDILSKSSLYIARVKYIDGKLVWGLAKPCCGCEMAIATFNIKKVYYTTDTNNKYEIL